MPITIELSLVYDPLDPIVSSMGYQGFAVANTATTWQIMNVQAKCDLATLERGLKEPNIKLLEEGKKLTLNYNTIISQYQTIYNQTDLSIHMSRSFARLKSGYVPFLKLALHSPEIFCRQ